jgi:hypothetical protein
VFAGRRQQGRARTFSVRKETGRPGLTKKRKWAKQGKMVFEDFRNRFATTFSKTDLSFKQI